MLVTGSLLQNALGVYLNNSGGLIYLTQVIVSHFQARTTFPSSSLKAARITRSVAGEISSLLAQWQ